MLATSKTPKIVGINVATIVGHRIQLALTLPAIARMPITVVGKSWIPVEFITTNIIIARVGLFPPLSNPFIALIP